jgi:hypothetical protein
MNSTTATRPAPTPSSWSIELALVIGLPMASIIIASSLAYAAYVHGFTELPKQEIHAAARR